MVIPSWNGAELLRQFLPSVRAAAERYRQETGSPVEILVVDDASSDGSPELLLGQNFVQDDSPGGQASGLGLRFLRNETNLGFNAAANRGFRAANHGLILLLNNDVEVPPDAVATLARHFADPQVFAVHGSVVDADTGLQCGAGQLLGFARGFLRVHQGYTVECGQNARGPLLSAFASGGSAMYHRESLLSLGGFDPLLSPAYWEDVELSYRAWKRGYTVLYEPGVTVRHRISSTMGQLARARLERLQQRNRLLYHWVHLHHPGLFAAHLGWVALLALSAPLRLQPRFLSALGDALGCLPGMRRRRREERALAARSDRELLRLFSEFSRQPGIVPRPK